MSRVVSKPVSIDRSSTTAIQQSTPVRHCGTPRARTVWESTDWPVNLKLSPLGIPPGLRGGGCQAGEDVNSIFTLILLVKSFGNGGGWYQYIS
jgi:hypothetical protein